jgi:hypothetical protein
LNNHGKILQIHLHAPPDRAGWSDKKAILDQVQQNPLAKQNLYFMRNSFAERKKSSGNKPHET